MLTLTLLAQLGAISGVTGSGRAPTHVWKVVAQFHRLWEPATGAPVVVAPVLLVLPGGGRTTDTTVLELELRPALTQGDTTIGAGALQRIPPTRATRATATLVARAPDSTMAWRLTARERPGLRSIFLDRDLTPLGRGAFALSDLVVGARGQGTPWIVGSDTLTLAPSIIIEATDAVQFFYQVRSTVALANITTKMTISRIVGRELQEDHNLTIQFTTPELRAGITGLLREVDLSRLTGSRYRVEVTVKTATGRMLGATSAMLELVR